MTGPIFSAIKVSQIPEQLNQQLNDNRKQIKQLLGQSEFSWQNLSQPLESLDDKLHHFWSPISHLHSVADSPELRESYQACLAPLSAYHTEVAHNHALYQAIASLQTSSSFEQLDQAQQKAIANQLRDFKLAGVALEKKQKERFAEICENLSQLSHKFSTQVLDATHGWQYHCEDVKALAGIPEHALRAAKAEAKAQELPGWVFTLDMPHYIAVITHADNRALRETFYHAYVTRASDKGPNANKWDNGPVMTAILGLRQELAQLLGFTTYAHYSLATKMVDNPEQVLDFLGHLSQKARNKALLEMTELATFANTQDGIATLEPWDISYYSEKLRENRFDFSQETLRPYFPATKVLTGLFEIVQRLYGIRVTALTGVDTWHPDVTVYDVQNQEGQSIARCYMDLYARKGKRGGAWMDECQIRRIQDDGNIQLPYAYLTCNFQAPVDDRPALLTHQEVVTLFHEFGHCLQHMLTTVNYADVSGINGVAWDAVELPSQFMENWAWQKESLALISSHIETGAALPDELFNKMQAAKNFHAAMGLMRQLEFALFDFRLHLDPNVQKSEQIQQLLDSVRDEVTVTPRYTDNRFQHSFSHIFAGGYAAGYYSYLWAEVMACDAFSLFEEKGLFDAKSAEQFLKCILQPGGSEEASVLFQRFRGRAPDISALLKQNGISD